MTDRISGTTSCSFMPRLNNVLVKVNYRIHPILIGNSEYQKDPKKVQQYSDATAVRMTVAAYGPDVKDLRIGEQVHIPNVAFEEVVIPENERDYTKIVNQFKELSNSDVAGIIKDGKYVDLVKYISLSDFQITGYWIVGETSTRSNEETTK
jgi:hypothetical protein